MNARRTRVMMSVVGKTKRDEEEDEEEDEDKELNQK
jgi:hypothetical protein